MQRSLLPRWALLRPSGHLPRRTGTPRSEWDPSPLRTPFSGNLARGQHGHSPTESPWRARRLDVGPLVPGRQDFRP
jgi:hypothetical protein